MALSRFRRHRLAAVVAPAGSVGLRQGGDGCGDVEVAS